MQTIGQHELPEKKTLRLFIPGFVAPPLLMTFVVESNKNHQNVSYRKHKSDP